LLPATVVAAAFDLAACYQVEGKVREDRARFRFR
jgi:hypothetical protein